jgi:hypothetical protein
MLNETWVHAHPVMKNSKKCHLKFLKNLKSWQEDMAMIRCHAREMPQGSQ